MFFALNYCRQNYTFTFSEVVNIPDWVFHVVIFGDIFCLIFEIRLPITIVDLLPLYNKTYSL